MANVPLVSLRGVCFEAQRRRILDSVDWEIRSGEHWAVLGPNGAGKTTLLRIACGYLWPNAGGHVLRDGRPLVDLRQLRRSIGWVTSILTAQVPPREPIRNTVLSGKFAQVGLRLLNGEAPSDDDRLQADSLLHQLGIAALSERPFGHLSQGEQQKVLIARALMPTPRLLVLDDPCAGLDPLAREAVLDSLAHIARHSASPSLVLVTHHIDEIVHPIDRLIALKAGRVVANDLTQQALNAELLAKLYGTDRPEIITRGGRRWALW